MNIHKTLVATFRTTATPRVYDATLSTEDVDREHDRILVAGWTIPRNVPLLWGHQWGELPIGRVVQIHVEGSALRGRLEFPTLGLYPFADQVEALVAANFLPSLSVGFAPGHPARNDEGGRDFADAELCEVSVVNVPANVAATIDRRADHSAMQKWLGDDLWRGPRWSDDEAIVLDLDGAEESVLDIDEPNPAVTAGLVGDWAAHHDEIDLTREELRDVLRAAHREAVVEVMQAELSKALLRKFGRVD